MVLSVTPQTILWMPSTQTFNSILCWGHLVWRCCHCDKPLLFQLWGPHIIELDNLAQCGKNGPCKARNTELVLEIRYCNLSVSLYQLLQWYISEVAREKQLICSWLVAGFFTTDSLASCNKIIVRVNDDERRRRRVAGEALLSYYSAQLSNHCSHIQPS